jgi:uncharacterized protein (TIGR03118 family)
MNIIRNLLDGRSSDRRRYRTHRQTLRVQPLEDRALMSHVPAMLHGPMVSVLSHKPKPTTFVQTDLISNDSSAVPAAKTDPNLVNPWGIVASPTGPFWFADNHTGLSTLATGAGVPQPLVVTVPPPAGSTAASSPTGIVLNRSTDFVITSGGKSGSGVFLFATEDGTISAWSPKVDATHAILAVDNSASGAVYKGLALAASSSGNRLYASNFHTGAVDVFDSSFKPVSLPAGAFKDAKIPKGFAPFNITNFGTNLLVTFAKQDKAKHDDAKGKGNGFVDLFDTDGHLISRLGRHGTLNSPWGVAVAPSSFGTFAGDLLVGNFGDGRVSAFKISGAKAKFVAQLPGTNGKPLSIKGLWGLSLGNGGGAGSTSTLFFTAGPNGETAGLFGSLTPSS